MNTGHFWYLDADKGPGAAKNEELQKGLESSAKVLSRLSSCDLRASVMEKHYISSVCSVLIKAAEMLLGYARPQGDKIMLREEKQKAQHKAEPA